MQREDGFGVVVSQFPSFYFTSGVKECDLFQRLETGGFGQIRWIWRGRLGDGTFAAGLSY
jgi:hypothetical protein